MPETFDTAAVAHALVPAPVGDGDASFVHQELRRLRADVDRANRRLRATWAVCLVACVGAFTLGLSPEGRAQFGVTLTSLNTRLTAAETKVTALQTKTASMSAITDATTGEATVRFSGVNVQVVNGADITNSVNGTGNLIVGYNERRGGVIEDNLRWGSHNIVVGQRNNYTRYGGVVFGDTNTISDAFASVTGGQNNTASNDWASVSGGVDNTASGLWSSVSGGKENKTTAGYTSVVGGFSNAARATGGSVAGGQFNTASGQISSVSGGSYVVQSSNYGWSGGGSYLSTSPGSGAYYSP